MITPEEFLRRRDKRIIIQEKRKTIFNSEFKLILREKIYLALDTGMDVVLSPAHPEISNVLTELEKDIPGFSFKFRQSQNQQGMVEVLIQVKQ